MDVCGSEIWDMDVPYRTVAETTITYMKSLRNIPLKLLASMMYVQHRFSLILCRQFANRMFAKQQYHPIPPSIAPATSATNASGTSTYFPSRINHLPTGLLVPLLTASSANLLSATQKNMIAASIAPSGQI